MDANKKVIIEWIFDFPLLRGTNEYYSFSIGAKPDPFKDYFYDRIFNATILKVNNPSDADIIGGLVYIKPKINFSYYERRK